MYIHVSPPTILLSLAFVSSIAARAAEPGASPDHPKETRWVEFPIPEKVHPPAAQPTKADALVAAIRNADLIWEIQFPVPENNRDGFWWIGPHFSPRGRSGTATYVLMPFPPAWAEGEGRENGPEPGDDEPRRPPFRLQEVSEPLLKALDDPDRWVAAHAILTHVTLRGEPDGVRLRKAMGWPRDAIIPGNLLWVIQRREDLKRRDDGWYEDSFIGLRVELRPEGPERRYAEWGTPGGRWTVREAMARVDASQQAPIREWWAERLRRAARAAAEGGKAGEQEPAPRRDKGGEPSDARR